ncbi:MAG TPA: YdcF family protein [Pyrinomonadaceae bacterium]
MLRKERWHFSKRHWRWARNAVLVLVTWSLLAWVAARALIVEAELAHADVIVILAGSSTYLERASHAAELFHQGRAPRIVLTNDDIRGGWSVEEQRNPLFVELAAAELERQGVPAEKIEIIPRTVSSTYDEAARVREYAEAHGIKSLLVVTSAYQSRRALWTLRRVFSGSEAEIGLSSPPPGQQSPSPATWWLHPLGWKMVPGEYLKLIYYKMHY